MTRYIVLWDVDVEVQFIDAWVKGDAQLRAQLTEVANWVDRNLSDDPDQKGQLSKDIGVRILAVPFTCSNARISVAYQVSPEDRQVRVVRMKFQL